MHYCSFQNQMNSEVQKPKLTFAFFAGVNHLSGSLRNQQFTLMGSKGHGS